MVKSVTAVSSGNIKVAALGASTCFFYRRTMFGGTARTRAWEGMERVWEDISLSGISLLSAARAFATRSFHAEDPPPCKHTFLSDYFLCPTSNQNATNRESHLVLVKGLSAPPVFTSRSPPPPLPTPSFLVACSGASRQYSSGSIPKRHADTFSSNSACASAGVDVPRSARALLLPRALSATAGVGRGRGQGARCRYSGRA